MADRPVVSKKSPFPITPALKLPPAANEGTPAPAPPPAVPPVRTAPRVLPDVGVVPIAVVKPVSGSVPVPPGPVPLGPPARRLRTDCCRACSACEVTVLLLGISWSLPPRNSSDVIAPGCGANSCRTALPVRVPCPALTAKTSPVVPAGAQPLRLSLPAVEGISSSDGSRALTVHAYHDNSVNRAIDAGVRLIQHNFLVSEETIIRMKQEGVALSLQGFVASSSSLNLPVSP